MNGADFFRGLFGFRPPRFPSENHGRDQPDGNEQEPRDYFNSFWRGGRNSDSEDDFFGGSGLDDTGIQQDIFGHFEEMFRHFDQLFSPGFGRVPFEGLPGISGNEEEKPSNNPRDYMLKQPFQDPPAEKNLPQTDSLTPPGFFGNIFERRLEAPKKEDKDLDSEIKNGDLSILFKDQNPSINSPSMNSVRPMPGESINRVQVYSYINRNGTKEEKRSYRDESGTEVNTVTKSLGSQQYSHTTKTHPDGRQEHTEDFINMSDSDRDNFKRNWHNQAHGGNTEPAKNITEYVRDLFRLGFPGFPSK